MKYTFTSLFLFVFFTSITAQAQFKVIGYLPYYRFDNLNQIELERCTHVNIAFINPDMEGELTAFGYDIDPVVTAIHDAGAEAWISLAGGYLPPDIDDAWTFWTLDSNRTTYIQSIIDYVQLHDIDGIDVDLEWQYVTDWYSPFVLELKAALDPLDIPLTAALPGSYRYPDINNEALEAYDWINMMVYDLRGPWDPSNPGQHSPFWWAEDCIEYWLNQGVPADKLTLGLPFYGYNFANTPVTSFTYRYMVTQDTSYAYLDQVNDRFYNGIPTIQSKTQLALDENLSGVMMWELGQDVLDPALNAFSLLRTIDEYLNPSVSTSQPVVLNLPLAPNPARDWVRVPVTEKVRVFDLNGQEVLRAKGPEINVSSLPSGIYTLRTETNTGVQIGKLVKI